MPNNPLRFKSLDDIPAVKQAKAAIEESERRRAAKAELRAIARTAGTVLFWIALAAAVVFGTIFVASNLAPVSHAAEVEGQVEILSVLSENAGDDSWSSKGIVFGGVNVGWGRIGLRANVGISREFDAGFIGEAGMFGRLGRGEVLLAAGVLNGRQAPDGPRDLMIYYRAAGFLKLFRWDDTDFEIVGGVRFLDLDAPKADLQAFAGIGWRGR